MELEVYKEKEEAKKKVVRLALRKIRNGNVVVVAVDETGEAVIAGHLVYFDSDGTIIRAGSVNSSLGFQRNSRGAIVDRDSDC